MREKIVSISAGREGLRSGDVSSCADFIAALRKFPLVMSSWRGVEGSGCREETRKGGGTSRRVSGW
jgi:hypothetical protein